MTEYSHEHPLGHVHQASETLPPENLKPAPVEEKSSTIVLKFSFDKKKIVPWVLAVLLMVSIAQTVQLLDIKFRLGGGALAAPAASSPAAGSASSLPKMVGGC